MRALALFAATIVAATLTAAPPTLAQTPPPGAPPGPMMHAMTPSVTVTGHAEVEAAPDMAVIQAGAVTQAPTAAAALDANNRVAAQIRKTLAARGVAERDVQTAQFDVSPQYRYDQDGRRPPEITGYQVTHVFRVRVRDVAKLGAILDALVQGGANQMGGVSFGFADPDKLRDQARTAAVADARRQAELYARATNTRLGPVIRIHEGGGPSGPIPFQDVALRSAEAAVPVAPGEQAVGVHVTVTWRLD